jgi:hypothetical protein
MSFKYSKRRSFLKALQQQRKHIRELCILSTFCTYVKHMSVTMINDFFYKEHRLFGPCNRDIAKFLWRSDVAMKCYLDEFIYTKYCTPITYAHSIYSSMFRLTLSAIISESSCIDLRSMLLVIEWCVYICVYYSRSYFIGFHNYGCNICIFICMCVYIFYHSITSCMLRKSTDEDTLMMAENVTRNM